jgi:2-dehydro-3-deoxygluconokinase
MAMEPDVSRIPVGEPAEAAFDAATIGETMVAFVSQEDPRRYLAVPAGAESNVAAGMARLGCRTQWVSRLGDDPLGRFVEASISAAGVAVEVIRDDRRPTGVMTVHVSGAERRTAYYRSESAARALALDDLRRVAAARWTHVTGITAALSASAAQLVEAVVERRFGHGGRVAFDVNHRPVLWPDTETAARVLLGLSRSADVVFIGDDEAATLFGTSDAAVLAELILRRDDQELVLKRGPGPASVVTLRGEITEPALQAAVVEVTGAGDAFAAGYLAATVFAWPARARLRAGHFLASQVLGVIDHIPPPLPASEREALSPSTLADLWAQAAGRGTA